ncbi:MAG: hypothetical protein ACOX3V_07480 [Bacillota bacterium]|jgi:energy-converting hydrogenase Eha subunit G
MNGKDLDFDERIVDYLSTVDLPEKEILETNPWSGPIGLITWGLILTTFRLNAAYLQYILPTIGVVLLFLGFRSLRHENKYFRVVWGFSVVRLWLRIADLIRVSTPLNSIDYPEPVVGGLALAFQVVTFLYFQAALNETQRKAQKRIEDAPLVRASLWAAVVYLVSLSPLSMSWLAFLFLAVCYVGIVRSLYKIGAQLGDAGYVLMNSRVRVNSRTVGCLYSLLALATVIVCASLSNHLSLDPRVFHQPETTPLRENVLNLGFPAECLQRLSDTHVLMLSDAVSVEAFRESLKNIDSTTVYVEMPEKVMYVMQYFTWKTGWPVWQDGILIVGETKTQDKRIVDSGLFYRKNGIDYSADFPRLECRSMAQSTVFGTVHPVAIAGALSFPFGSESQGGYVFCRYSVMADTDRYITNTIFNYVHLSNPLRIPYARTEDLILGGAYMFGNKLQQHYTSYGSRALAGTNR